MSTSATRQFGGLYGGIVGYLDFAGNLDFCITIRTVLIENGRAYVQAGAGIVADSNPAAEYEETRDKARAVIRALEALTKPCDVRLHTDSLYVQKGISEWIHSWKKRDWRTADKKPVKNDDLWKELDRLAQRHKIEWLWVRGHSGHEGNEHADRLANRGVQSVLENPLVTAVIVAKTLSPSSIRNGCICVSEPKPPAPLRSSIRWCESGGTHCEMSR